MKSGSRERGLTHVGRVARDCVALTAALSALAVALMTTLAITLAMGLTTLSAMGGARAARASDSISAGTTVLDRYLAGFTTLRTEFTQTVSDSHGTVLQSGSGSLLVRRPGEFRWDYEPRSPATAGQPTAAASDAEQGQLLVADGKNLWFYDRELAQVTVKPLATGLSSTPIMLLSGATDELRASFTISPAPMQDGLSWVEVKPRSEQADFSDARLGFKADELVRMLVHDMLGQTVQLDFAHSQRNAPIDPSAFQFKVPSGVDVIGSPTT